MDLTVRESPLVRAISSPGERRSKKGRSWRCDAWGGEHDGVEVGLEK